MLVQPYLCFEGRCEEALEFYRKALGAELLGLRRFADMPEPKMPGQITPGTENKVMHASIRIGESVLMASDGRCAGAANFQGMSLSITVKSDAEAQRVFAALAEGGQVTMPIMKTFFSSSFGMIADRFGVSWMVIVGAK